MSGPWEDYQQPPTAQGDRPPWEDYQPAASNPGLLDRAETAIKGIAPTIAAKAPAYLANPISAGANDAAQWVADNPKQAYDRFGNYLPVAAGLALSPLGPGGAAIGAGLGDISRQAAGVYFQDPKVMANITPGSNFSPAAGISAAMQTGLGGASEVNGLVKAAPGAAPYAERAMGAIGGALKSGGIAMGRRALGFTKALTRTAPQLNAANNAARVALDQGVITPLASAEGMAGRAAALEDTSGKGIGDFLKTSNSSPNLPVVAEQATTGEPHALYEYGSDLGKEIHGPDYPTEHYYKLYGDKSHPVFQERGWGSDVQKDFLDQHQIPVKGVTPRSVALGETPPPEAFGPTQGNSFNPQSAIEDLEKLRPTNTSGNVLRGGHYDAANAKIDKAIETIRANGTEFAGNTKVGFQDANSLKGTLQDQANWKTNKDAGALDRQISGAFRSNLDNQLSDVADRTGNQAGYQDFLQNKRNYGAAGTMQEGLQNRMSSEAGNRFFGLTDFVAGAPMVMAHDGTHLAATAAAIAGKKIAEKWGAPTVAYASYGAGKALQAAPRYVPGIATAPLAAAYSNRQKLISLFIDGNSQQ